ncbi:MAG: hypothetical protein M5U34_46390 [Chloroflexi bacterium]|nr:hypothetical protein [Chloroflexota bacterium]
MAQVVPQLGELQADTYAQNKAAAYSDSALAHLQAAQPQGAAGQALTQLADMLLNRDF